MLTESQNHSHGITDMLKTVYPAKTMFCGGYNNVYKMDIKFKIYE